MKARLSTKMVGESLEQHCETEFNKVRALGFPRAVFEKDTDARGGSKGDFMRDIFVIAVWGINQKTQSPFFTGSMGVSRTTPCSDSVPRMRTSLLTLPMCMGVKFTQQTTCLPIRSSGL